MNYEDRIDMNEKINKITQKALKGELTAENIVCEGATEDGDALFKLADWGFGDNVNQYNYKKIMTVDQQDDFIKIAMALRDQIIDYIKDAINEI